MDTSLSRIKSHGFTIVELLIVIVVIGILAAIGIVTYSGVQQRARDGAVLSDTDGVSSELARYATQNNGVYGSSVAWYSPSGANPNIQFTLSSGDVIDVVTSSTDYCIRSYNPLSSKYKTLSTAYKVGSTNTACNLLGPSAGAQADSPIINGGVVTTLAGSGTSGFTDGTGTAASFSYPYAVQVDSSGTVFVGDTVNGAIRKITPAGVVTTLAGSGAYAYADGTGSGASFQYIYGLVINNSNGNVFATDSGGGALRQITPAGVVTTLVGPTPLGVSCQASPPYMRSPSGLVQDANGNYYVSDSNNACIRKISPSGVVTTFAGSGTNGSADGQGTAASFNMPQGLAIDSAGNIYVADSGNNRIRKITPSGLVSTLAGSTSGFVNGTGTAAKFSTPFGVAVDGAGTVYVADRGNNVIRQITTAGVVTTLAGSTQGYQDGTATNAKFYGPAGIAIDGNGVLYVAEAYGHRIRIIR